MRRSREFTGLGPGTRTFKVTIYADQVAAVSEGTDIYDKEVYGASIAVGIGHFSVTADYESVLAWVQDVEP